MHPQVEQPLMTNKLPVSTLRPLARSALTSLMALAAVTASPCVTAQPARKSVSPPESIAQSATLPRDLHFVAGAYDSEFKPSAENRTAVMPRLQLVAKLAHQFAGYKSPEEFCTALYKAAPTSSQGLSAPEFRRLCIKRKFGRSADYFIGGMVVTVGSDEAPLGNTPIEVSFSYCEVKNPNAKACRQPLFGGTVTGTILVDERNNPFSSGTTPLTFPALLGD